MKPLALTIGLLCWIGLPSQSTAQLVRVGPLGGVSLRLPFVSVDTLPFGGGTSVRAPFTAVDTGLYGLNRYGGYGYGLGGYRYGGLARPPYYSYRYDYVAPVAPVAPVLPVAPYGGLGLYDQYDFERDYQRRRRLDDLADTHRELMYRAARPSYDEPSYHAFTAPPVDSAAELALRLRQSAARLTRSLRTLGDDAETWLEYLDPVLIVDSVDNASAGVDFERLAGLWANYEGTAGNPNLTGVWSLDGFHQTHQRLRQWIESQPGAASLLPAEQPAIGPIGTGTPMTTRPSAFHSSPPDREGELLPPVRGSL